MKKNKASLTRGAVKGSLSEELAARIVKIDEIDGSSRASIRYVNPNFLDRSPLGENAPFVGEGEIHSTLLGWTAR